MPPARKFNCKAGKKSENIRKQKDESLRIASSPPNQPGSMPLMEMPTAANNELKTKVAAIDWRSIFRAPAKSPAPVRCAT